MALRRSLAASQEDLQSQFSAVDLLAKNYYDDLKYLTNFDFHIVTDVDLIKIRVLCGKYSHDAVPTKKNVVDVVVKLVEIIQVRIERYVKGGILQRLVEETANRLPETPKQEKSRNPEDSWRGD